MKIIYNPKDGAPIRGFIFKGDQVEPHYPDGAQVPQAEVSNGLKQYEDEIADALLETFGFLELKDVSEAKEIVERPEQAKFECDFPGCTFVANKNIALLGHKRSHRNLKKTTGEQTVVDESIVPVAAVKRVEAPTKPSREGIDGQAVDIQNGTDKDGVDWYGDGVQVENKSTQVAGFGPGKGKGQAHF